MSIDIYGVIQNLRQQLDSWEHIVNEILSGEYETKHFVYISLAQIISWELKNRLDGLQSLAGENNLDVIPLVNEYDVINAKLMRILQKMPDEKMIDFLVKDIEKKLIRYESSVEFINRVGYEINFGTLRIRDSIEFLLEKLSTQIDVGTYKHRLIHADQVLKENYKHKPENLDSFTIEFRERTFKLNALWWWYMDINVSEDSRLGLTDA